YPLPAVTLYKEPPQTFGRDILADRFRIKPATGVLNGQLADVGGEDLYPDALAAVIFEIFQQRHRNRVRLRSSRATGHPDADRISGRALVEQTGKHLVAKHLERSRFAEEPRHVNEDVLIERGYFCRTLFQKRQIL